MSFKIETTIETATGRDVTIGATATPDPSSWDYQGGTIIEDVYVRRGDRIRYIDSPSPRIYSALDREAAGYDPRDYDPRDRREDFEEPDLW